MSISLASSKTSKWIRPSSYKYCMVPDCKSTTSKTPDKVFLILPVDKELRKKWCDAMKRDNQNLPLSATSVRHVCEDHFDLENDLENYVKFKLTGGKKFLKKNVVPHIFECQKSTPTKQSKRKRRRAEVIGELWPTSTSSLQASLHIESTEVMQEDSTNKVSTHSRIADEETSDCFDSSFLEPEVVIKEEPIDIYEDPTPSRLDHEFILPGTDSYQPSSSPVIKEAFTVVKSEPAEEPQQITSYCRTTQPNKRQTSETADVAEQISTNGWTTKPSQRKTTEKDNVLGLTDNRPTDEDAARSKTNSSKDSFDVYGEYIAAKLRNLDLKSCTYVQKAFADILFDAEVGKFK